MIRNSRLEISNFTDAIGVLMVPKESLQLIICLYSMILESRFLIKFTKALMLQYLHMVKQVLENHILSRVGNQIRKVFYNYVSKIFLRENNRIKINK